MKFNKKTNISLIIHHNNSDLELLLKEQLINVKECCNDIIIESDKKISKKNLPVKVTINKPGETMREEIKNNWLLKLNTGEFLSIQLQDTINTVLNLLGLDVMEVKVPIVICGKNGKILNVLPSEPRLFRLNSIGNKIKEFRELPLIRMELSKEELKEELEEKEKQKKITTKKTKISKEKKGSKQTKTRKIKRSKDSINI